MLERTGAPLEKHVQAPVRGARAVVFESSGAQGSASSQASADDAVVGDSGGKDEVAEATSGWTRRYVLAKISHSQLPNKTQLPNNVCGLNVDKNIHAFPLRWLVFCVFVNC